MKEGKITALSKFSEWNFEVTATTSPTYERQANISIRGGYHLGFGGSLRLLILAMRFIATSFYDA